MIKLNLELLLTDKQGIVTNAFNFQNHSEGSVITKSIDTTFHF